MPSLRPVTVLVSALLAGAPAHAQQAPPVEVEQPWARPTAPRQTVGAAYLRLRSAVGDRLLGASSPAADRVELHQAVQDGDIMRMRERDGLALPAGRVVALTPGGLHLMLFGLKAPLARGQSVPLILRFAGAGAQMVQLAVGIP